MMLPIRLKTAMFIDASDMERSRLSLTSLMFGLALHNTIWLRYYPRTPKLYDTHVIYKEETNSEVWQDIPTTLKRGYGDCEDLACWRIAELRVSGVDAMPYVTWREDGARTIYHALVRLPNNRIEDPSRALGMRHPIVRRPVILPFTAEV